jgi:hypothetical protein
LELWRHNVKPLSARGGAHATPDKQASIPPPRSAPAAHLCGRWRARAPRSAPAGGYAAVDARVRPK